MKYKVGDKVRIIKPLYSDNPRLGETMQIRQIRDGETVVDYILKDIKDEWHYVKKDEIEPIQGFGTFKEVEEVEDLKTEQKYTKHSEICNRLNDLYISKNKEYGDSFGKAYKRLGKTSAITQIYHKFERVLEIYDKENVEYESLEDNLIDTANYIIMLLVEMQDD